MESPLAASRASKFHRQRLQFGSSPRYNTHMKSASLTCGAVLLFFLGISLCQAQQTAAPGAPGAAPKTDTASPATPALGARRGGGRGGPPITPAEQAEIAPLAELPAWKAGAEDGNY